MPNPCIGCGFELDSNGNLQIKGDRSAQWPSAWGAIGSCNGLRCDPVTGNLHAPPPDRCVVAQADSRPINATEFGAVFSWDMDDASLGGSNPWANFELADIGTLGQASLKNVSNCLPMVVQYVFYIGPVYANIDADVNISVNLEVAVDGYAGQTFSVNIYGNTAFPHIESRSAQTGILFRPVSGEPAPFNTYVAAGATTTFSARLQGIITDATGTVGQSVAIGGGGGVKAIGWTHAA